MMSEKGQKDHEINGVKLGFTDKKITSYGGFSMLAMFFKKVELKAALNQFIPIQETSPNAMKIYDNGNSRRSPVFAFVVFGKF